MVILLVECNTGHYGPNCVDTCGKCEHISCDKTNGHCKIPVCSPGWKGPMCDISKLFVHETSYGLSSSERVLIKING